MKATVKKWGNSAAVRIPASVMQAIHLYPDEVISGRRPAERCGDAAVCAGGRRYRLAKLHTAGRPRAGRPPACAGPEPGYLQRQDWLDALLSDDDADQELSLRC